MRRGVKRGASGPVEHRLKLSRESPKESQIKEQPRGGVELVSELDGEYGLRCLTLSRDVIQF